MGNPVEISPNVIAGIPHGGTLHTPSQGIAEAGTVYPSIDGSRLLTHVVELNAYYIQTDDNTNQPWKIGRVFKQNAGSFGMDISVGGTSAIVAKKLAATKSVISNFIDIYLGCMAVAGGPVAWAVTGMQVVVAGGKIKQNYDLYCRALEAFVDDDMALRKMMPVFYDHMFVELFLGRIEADLTGKVKEMAVKGIVKNKAVAQLVGVFIGKIGEDAMTRTLKGMSKIIREVLLKVIDHCIQGKPLSEDQIEKLSHHHLIPMYGNLSRVPLRMDRSKEVLRECARHASAVRPRLEKIAKAIDALVG